MAETALVSVMTPMSRLVAMRSHGPTGIAHDEDDEQRHDHGQEEPAGIAAAQLARQHRAEETGGQHGERHGPARLRLDGT
jgi:hypothetical protein